MREYVEFHNPTSKPRESTLVLDFRGLPPDIRASFVLTRLTTAQPLSSSITGIKTPGAHTRDIDDKLARWVDRIEDELEETTGELLEWLGCWVENLGRQLEELPPKWCRLQNRPHFEPVVYTALPGSRVEVSGVQLPPFGTAAALLSIHNRGDLPPGSKYTFQAQQFTDNQLSGGSTYIVRIAGDIQLPPPSSPTTEEDVDLTLLPPWVQGPVEQARQYSRWQPQDT